MRRFVVQQWRSKVSQRIVLTVLLCSLVPIAALVGMTLYNVQNRLERDTLYRLHHASKTIGMALFAELSSLDFEMRQLARSGDLALSGKTWTSPDYQTPLKQGWFYAESNRPAGAPVPTARIARRLEAGQAFLSDSGTGDQRTIHLWTPATDRSGRQGIAVAEISRTYLWNHALGFLPQNAELIILDQQNRPLLHGKNGTFKQFIKVQDSTAGHYRLLERELEDQTWLVARWNLFLKAGFDAPDWCIVVAEPKRFAFAGLIDFRRNAFLTSVMTLWIILLASSVLVRKTLTPLEKLKKATQQISRGDFDLRLAIDSGDEFQALGESFNGMAGKIKRQIVYQKDLGLAVRRVLGADSEEEVIRQFFNGLSRTLEIRRAGLLVHEPELSSETVCWETPLQGVVSPCRTRVEVLDHTKLAELGNPDEFFIYGSGADLPVRLPAFKDFGAGHVLFFPIPLNRHRQALLILADREQVPGEEQLTGIRQLADQLGVALNRIAMTRDLQAMNLGTLTALARAVDANSPWTHGHSERVTEYALLIARELGFTEEQRNDLHRAGLLHDLGKVAIPSAVLNKQGKLSEDEYRLMQGHPAEGERIVEPIQAFAGLRKIIRQHHERWDGQGYPDGLSGEQIHPGARIIAVADVYDALYSDRPYRDGWPQEKVLDFLREQSGKMFDPTVVEVFLTLLEKDAMELAMSSLVNRQAG